MIGVPFANRLDFRFERTVGFFANTVPIWLNLSNTPTPFTLIDNVRDVLTKAMERQAIPFDEIVAKINPRRFKNTLPLCQIAFAYQNITNDVPKLDEIHSSRIPLPRKKARYDLTLEIIEGNVPPEIVIEYATDLYTPESICHFLNEYIEYLNTYSQLLATKGVSS